MDVASFVLGEDDTLFCVHLGVSVVEEVLNGTIVVLPVQLGHDHLNLLIDQLTLVVPEETRSSLIEGLNLTESLGVTTNHHGWSLVGGHVLLILKVGFFGSLAHVGE